jgi:hypothetical protein
MVNKVGRDADNQKNILNVQSGKALSMFDPAAWPCCHTEFFYGDCIPFDNTRPKFIPAHDVFRILLNREELEYSLPQDEASELMHGKVYKALTTSRWDSPEMVAVFADTMRRKEILTKTNLAFKNVDTFRQDLNLVRDASPADFEALEGYATLGQAFVGQKGKQNPRAFAALKI